MAPIARDCDHEQYLDVYTNKIFMTCFCYCSKCYSQDSFINEGNGCIDTDCFCRNPEMPPSAIRITNNILKEDVVADLPENPGKTGTCRKCKAPTYRKGDRGRFPVLCEGCK